MLKVAKQRSARQKALASFDKQADGQKQLAENYGNWIEAVAAKQKTVLHGALNGISYILGILLIGIFFDSWLERLLGKTSFDRRQVETTILCRLGCLHQSAGAAWSSYAAI